MGEIEILDGQRERPQRETIVVIDYGSQYSQLITRRIREAQVYCEMLPWDAPPQAYDRLNPRGLVLSGGPNSVYDEGAPGLPDHLIGRGVPILGICYGMQLLALAYGGEVAEAQAREYGMATVTIDVSDSPLFEGLAAEQRVWMSHGDRIDRLPPGFEALAHTPNSPVAAMADRQRGLYGLQFHPEVVHTEQGKAILANFCLDICGCRGDWTPGSFIDEQVADIRQRVGDGQVICAVSGGVDSSVVATLVSRAVGDQLTTIFVNNGLLRKTEAQENLRRFERYLDANLVYVDARQQFLNALAGVADPERKRVIIGRKFIEIFEAEAE